MSKLQRSLLVIVAAVLLIVTVTTWGSIGSVMCVVCLIVMGAALLYRKLVLDRDEDTFDWEL